MRITKPFLLLVFLSIGFIAMGQSADTAEVHTYTHPSMINSSNHQLRLGIGAKLFEPARFMIYDWDEPPFYTSETELNINSFSTFHEGARYTTGALFGEYIFIANKYLQLGATFTYFSYYSNYYSNYGNDMVGTNSSNHLSIYPTLRFNYINRPFYKVYSSISLGPRFVYKSDNSPTVKKEETAIGIAGQITLLGFSVGNKNFWFVDLCTLGTQGFITTGIGFKMK